MKKKLVLIFSVLMASSLKTMEITTIPLAQLLSMNDIPQWCHSLLVKVIQASKEEYGSRSIEIMPREIGPAQVAALYFPLLDKKGVIVFSTLKERTLTLYNSSKKGRKSVLHATDDFWEGIRSLQRGWKFISVCQTTYPINTPLGREWIDQELLEIKREETSQEQRTFLSTLIKKCGDSKLVSFEFEKRSFSTEYVGRGRWHFSFKPHDTRGSKPATFYVEKNYFPLFQKFFALEIDFADASEELQNLLALKTYS